MLQDVELLNHIHQNADMARDSLRHILELSHSDRFSDAIRTQIDGYTKAYETSDRMLAERGSVGKDARPMSKTMANVTGRMESMMDPTDSRLAEMVIKGSTMGITKLTKQLHDYQSEDQEVREFAENQIKREQSNIERMKPFL